MSTEMRFFLRKNEDFYGNTFEFSKIFRTFANAYNLKREYGLRRRIYLAEGRELVSLDRGADDR